MVDLDVWERALAAFGAAPAALVAERSVERRSEVKFVTPVDTALAVLSDLERDYLAMVAGSRRVASYRSIYFDTPSWELFQAHRQGRRIRRKVRVRHYPDRRVSALEVKVRLSDTLSHKLRRLRPYGIDHLSEDDRVFIAAYSPQWAELRATAWIDYARVSLVNPRVAERVTFDLDLRMRCGAVEGRLPGVAIIEVKQGVSAPRSAALQVLRARRVRRGWASKYCAAVALTGQGGGAKRLRPDLRVLEALGPWVIRRESAVC